MSIPAGLETGRDLTERSGTRVREKVEKMSERCSHCHRATDNPCSSYSGRARVQALQSCAGMSEVDRYREAATCEGATDGDREQAICIALSALGGEERNS